MGYLALHLRPGPGIKQRGRLLLQLGRYNPIKVNSLQLIVQWETLKTIKQIFNRIMYFFILQTFSTNKAYILLNITSYRLSAIQRDY